MQSFPDSQAGIMLTSHMCSLFHVRNGIESLQVRNCSRAARWQKCACRGRPWIYLCRTEAITIRSWFSAYFSSGAVHLIDFFIIFFLTVVDQMQELPNLVKNASNLLPPMGQVVSFFFPDEFPGLIPQEVKRGWCRWHLTVQSPRRLDLVELLMDWNPAQRRFPLPARSDRDSHRKRINKFSWGPNLRKGSRGRAPPRTGTGAGAVRPRRGGEARG